MSTSSETPTPGPWNIGVLDDSIFIVGPRNSSGSHVVAQLLSSNRRVDVNLICAAPDLLAAVRSLLIAVSSTDDVREDRLRSAKERAEAAIAKAMWQPM